MRFFACLLLSLVALQAVIAADPEYTEVTVEQLKVAPEKYEHEYIVYEGPFLNTHSTFLPYMEKSGFRSTKYVWLVIGPSQVPVLARKTDTIVEQAAQLKRGQMVRVYGRIREFKADPKQTIHPHFYVSVDKLEPLETRQPVPGPSRRPRFFPRRARR